MKSNVISIWILALSFACNPVAAGAEPEPQDDDTMIFVAQGSSAEHVVAYIELPGANPHAAFGLGVVNAARKPPENRKFGEWVAAQVRADVEALRSDNAATVADVRADAAKDAADNARRDRRENNPGRGRPGS